MTRAPFRFAVLNLLSEDAHRALRGQWFTVFHLAALVSAMSGCTIGMEWGLRAHGWLAGIAGTLLGLALALAIARTLPRICLGVFGLLLRQGWLLVTPQSGPAVMRRADFGTRSKAMNRDDDRQMIVAACWATAVCLLFLWVDSTHPGPRLQRIEDITFVVLFCGVFVFMALRGRRLLRKHGLLCPGCELRITDENGYFRLPASGRCRHCGRQLSEEETPEAEEPRTGVWPTAREPATAAVAPRPSHRYPYNPDWRSIRSCAIVGAGALLLVFSARLAWLGWPLATLFLGLALVLTVRRVCFPRFLELEENAISIPTGALGLRITRLPYADIDWLKSAPLNPATLSFLLWSGGRSYAVNASALPEPAAYAAVIEFLNALPAAKAATKQLERQPPIPCTYAFRCTYEGEGEIQDSKATVLWKFESRYRGGGKPKSAYYGKFTLPDFVVFDPMGREVLRIVGEGRLIAYRFGVFAGSSRVGTIRLKSLLLTRYDLEFADGSRWTFQMPLFTVHFRGVSGTGARAQARLWSHNVWLVRIEEGVDVTYLIPALAFIHRERLRCV